MSGSNLSQYFANDPPSLFDSLINIDGNATQMSEFEKPGNSSTQKDTIIVTDDVRDIWEPAHTEPGIPPQLTMPGVHSSNDMDDPVRNMVNNLLSENEATQRKILSANDVTQDERGLRQLIENGFYRSAVNLTSRLLTIYGQGYGRSGLATKHSPHSLQLWFTRFALLTKLRQYDLCQIESEPFGLLNRADLYYEFYPEMYPGRSGSMVSFSFRLLLAELSSYLGSTTVAINRLTDMISICSEIRLHYQSQNNKNAELFWQKRENRVMHSIINCAISIKDFSLADNLMETLCNQENLAAEEKRALYSAWGRIYLQCGDVIGAERKFNDSRKQCEVDGSISLRDCVDRGLIAVAQNDFQKAYGFFHNALKLDNTNIMLLNNMGVCLLYSGKLKDAIQMYERAIDANPKLGLNELILLNLSTLYELESSNDVLKKLDLLKKVNRHRADLYLNLDFCLKLQTINNI